MDIEPEPDEHVAPKLPMRRDLWLVLAVPVFGLGCYLGMLEQWLPAAPLLIAGGVGTLYAIVRFAAPNAPTPTGMGKHRDKDGL